MRDQPSVPQEAIEAAAEAINKFAAKYVGVLDPVPLKDMNLLDREHALGEARAALEAAAPYMLIHVHHHDIEKRAEHFNEGYEAAVSQGLADDPSLADDWLQEKLREAQAEAWTAGWESGWDDAREDLGKTPNPYRKDTQ